MLTLHRGDIITSRRHKRQLQVAWGGSTLGYVVCRVVKRDGRAGKQEVVVTMADIASKQLLLL